MFDISTLLLLCEAFFSLTAVLFSVFFFFSKLPKVLLLEKWNNWNGSGGIIPYILCSFYTTKFLDPEVLHSKVHKFARQIEWINTILHDLKYLSSIQSPTTDMVFRTSSNTELVHCWEQAYCCWATRNNTVKHCLHHNQGLFNTSTLLYPSLCW